jgi:hypothetical protein
VTKYSWDGQILHKTKSESGPKLEQKKIIAAAEPRFFSATSERFIQT